MPLKDLLPWLVVVVGGFWVLRPLVLALADRIRHRGALAEDTRGREQILEELREVRREVADLNERVDFAERLLARQKDAAQLAPPR